MKVTERYDTNNRRTQELGKGLGYIEPSNLCVDEWLKGRPSERRTSSEKSTMATSRIHQRRNASREKNILQETRGVVLMGSIHSMTEARSVQEVMVTGRPEEDDSEARRGRTFIGLSRF